MTRQIYLEMTCFLQFSTCENHLNAFYNVLKGLGKGLKGLCEWVHRALRHPANSSKNVLFCIKARNLDTLRIQTSLYSKVWRPTQVLLFVPDDNFETFSILSLFWRKLTLVYLAISLLHWGRWKERGTRHQSTGRRNTKQRLRSSKCRLEGRKRLMKGSSYRAGVD